MYNWGIVDPGSIESNFSIAVSYSLTNEHEIHECVVNGVAWVHKVTFTVISTLMVERSQQGCAMGESQGDGKPCWRCRLEK